jgi:hypothetical protein
MFIPFTEEAVVPGLFREARPAFRALSKDGVEGREPFPARRWCLAE